MTVERPRAFADLWEARGTPRPPTTMANPLGGARADDRPLTPDEVAATTGVDRGGGIHLSPDGSEVAFAWDRDGAREIYSAPIMGDRIIQLTDLDGRSAAPRWSPDGRWIAFARDVAGVRSLWVVDRDGEHAREVTADDPPHGSVSLSAQGIPLWSADTASPALAAAKIDHVPGSASWSPDGSTIAFTTRARGTTKIALAHVRDGRVAGVEVIDATPFEDSEPIWRPDGRGVVYRRREHGKVTAHRVFTVSHADDAVLDVPGWVFAPQVGADSETIIAVLVDRHGADVVVRPKGAVAVARITRTASATGQ